MVGLGEPDDAAVYRTDEQNALVVTVDYFPPVVDDAGDFGRIAAANALSDVYAMGGRPLFALNIASLPADMPPEVARAILLGAAQKVQEAGAVIAGGHTIDDKEPKFGLCVVGNVAVAAMMRKAGARPGDVLVLTKPLGTGLITTAGRAQAADEEDLRAAVASMATLNAPAAQAAVAAGVQAATDITGFGLLGHAAEMAAESGVGFAISWCALPWLRGTQRYAREWRFPGGAKRNADFFAKDVVFDLGVGRGLEEYEQLLPFAPETSGGLLLSVPEGRHSRLERELKSRGVAFWTIGKVREGNGITVTA